MAGIVVLAVAVRVLTALLLGNDVSALPGIADQHSYHQLAQRLIGGHGFTFDRMAWPMTQPGEPTAHWSYLYTGFLALFYAVFDVLPVIPRLFQAAVVGVAHPLLAYWLTLRVTASPVGPNRLAALIAAGITAGYAYFVYYAGALMTEPFYITGILLTLAIALRLGARPEPRVRRSVAPQESETEASSMAMGVALGAVAGLTVLLRQVFLLTLPVIVVWLLVRRRHDLGRLARPLAVAGVVLALTIVPFTAYNWLRFDRFVLLNTNAGFAFFWANHPIHGTNFYDILPAELGSYQDLVPNELRGLDEADMDRALMARGVDFVVSEPWRYVRLSVSRIPDYFKFWPEPTSSRPSNVARVLSFGITLPFMLYGLAVSIRRRPSPAAWLLMAFAAFYVGLHLASWALIRYRLPVDAVMIPFAGWAVADIARRLFGDRLPPLGGPGHRSLVGAGTSPPPEVNRPINASVDRRLRNGT